MQNVAQAYKETQVGTTGQGEIVVMLYDGALRFLGQAREKIVAKDYASKGVLISRTLDIVNELDSSLNMEAGGDLAQNLHQLYFLCTTRLLQANLKLDLAKLDSVVGILSGLRDAFAQVVATPEARAACAQIGAKQAVKQNATTPRPMLSFPTPMTTPRSAVAGLYHQQSHDTDEGSAPAAQLHKEPVFSPAANTMLCEGESARTTQASHHIQNYGQAPGFQIPRAFTPVSPALSFTMQTEPVPAQAAEPQLVEPQTSTPQAKPAPMMPRVDAPSSGFADKRLALYGKMQGR